MRTFTSQTTVQAPAEVIFDAITDPEAIRLWSPVDFEIDEDRVTRRLKAGTQVRVAGRLAGLEVAFDVEVHEAADGRLELTASGPVEIDVAYGVAPVADGTEVSASVAVRSRGGFRGGLLSRATDALLSAGALDAAVSRIARNVQSCPAHDFALAA